MWETPDGLHGFSEFSTELFKRETISEMVQNFELLLGLVVATPSARLSESLDQLNRSGRSVGNPTSDMR